jgi:tetratricopeptide (TPR) repeat protein
LLQKGNSFYQNKDYENSINEYEKLVNDGYEGASLYYNLGNAYYRTNRLGYAILYYEKALKISPNDEDIQHNLALANSKTIDRIETLPKFFVFQWWEGLLAFFNLSGWTYTAFFFYLLLIICAFFYFFHRNRKVQKISFYSGLAASLLMIFSAALLIIKLNRELSVKNAVIIEPEASVKVQPDSESPDAFIIHEGLKVRLEDNVQNWAKIRLLDGKVGWIEKENLKLI